MLNQMFCLSSSMKLAPGVSGQQGVGTSPSLDIYALSKTSKIDNHYCLLLLWGVKQSGGLFIACKKKLIRIMVSLQSGYWV